MGASLDAYKRSVSIYGISVGDQPSKHINVFADWDARLDIFCQLYVLIVQLTHCNLDHNAEAGTLFIHRRQADQTVSNDQHSLHGVCEHNAKAGTLFMHRCREDQPVANDQQRLVVVPNPVSVNQAL